MSEDLKAMFRRMRKKDLMYSGNLGGSAQGGSGGGGFNSPVIPDTTAPELSSAVVPSAGTTLGLTYNESLLASGDGIPDIADYSISSGGTAVTISAVSVSGAIVTLNLARTITAGETLSFNYTAGASGRVQDAANNIASNLSSQAVTNNAADVTAPTLSNPVDDNAGETDGALTVDTDEGNGTLYWVISTSASAPSAAQVKAGQMHTGAAAADSGSQAVSGTGTQTITGESGLTANTTYYAHFMHEDASSNQSAVSSGNGFTTDAGGEVATFSGGGVLYPTIFNPSMVTAITNGIQNSTYAIDAVNEKVAFIGTIYIDGRPGAAKTISAAGSGKIHFLPGTVTFADTLTTPTNIRVGIQDLDDTTGGSGAGIGATPDGTSDVYADLVAGTDTITSATWQTATMTTGTKDITHGQKIAVVIEMTARGANNTDSVTVAALAAQVSHAGFPQVQHYTASYVRQTSVPIVVIEFNDGTLGYILGGSVHSAVNAVTYASSSTPDEYGIIFQLPFESTAISLWFQGRPTSNAANAELVLYSDPLGVTPVAEATITLDANNFNLSDGLRFAEFTLPTAFTLAANTDYAVALKPTTTTNVAAMTWSLADANYRKFLAGTNVSRATRTNGGAFVATTTEFPLLGVRLG
jgi:uncharacterized repeat protein (TIGR02059 family)